MNKEHFNQIIDHYVTRFEKLNTAPCNEVYKWQIAERFRPMLDEALSANDVDLPAKLAAVVLLTEQTIDNRYELSFYALSDYARKEPAAVRDALRKLIAPDGDDLTARSACFADFLDFCDAMKAKYNPESWRYNASIRLPMMITGYYDPDHYYLYKSSQAQAYADCVEFYDDWGSGRNINLNIYHRMCDELVAVVKTREDLLTANSNRGSYSEKPLHPDSSLHILAFDIIFCSTVYNLFEGIHYGVKNAAQKREYISKVNEARKAADAQADALEQASELAHAEAFFAEKLSIGSAINHKKFGMGKIVDLTSPYIIEVAFSNKEGTTKLVWRDCVLSKIISFPSEVSPEEYDEMITLIRRSDTIKRNVEAAEKKLEAYAEYL